MGAADEMPPSRVAAASWPQWHGADRTNVSPETGLLATWPPAGPRLLWTAAGCGKGYSSVTIADGRIYTAGELNKQTVVMAFDLEGKRLWQAPNGDCWQAPEDIAYAKDYYGARSTPTVAGELVYHLGELGGLTAYRAATGEKLWTINIREQFAAPLPKYGYAESVLVVDDRLFCYPGGEKGYMVALNAKTGETVWANTIIGDSAAYCSPILVRDRQARQLITMSTEAALGVDADTGRLLWRYPFTNPRKINANTPLYRDGAVFITSGYGAGGVMLGLVPVGDRVVATKLWATSSLDDQHGGVVIVAGAIYGSGHESPGWSRLDVATGKLCFRDRALEKGSLTVADGMLYCLGEKGSVALVAPARQAFEIRNRFTLPQTPNGPVWAHPVVCGGRLYIRHGDLLYCYDVKGDPP